MLYDVITLTRIIDGIFSRMYKCVIDIACQHGDNVYTSICLFQIAIMMENELVYDYKPKQDHGI